MKTKSTLWFLVALGLVLVIQIPVTKVLSQHSVYFCATVALPYLLGSNAYSLMTGNPAATPAFTILVLYDAAILLPTLLRHRMKKKTYWIVQASTLAVTLLIGLMICPLWAD